MKKRRGAGNRGGRGRAGSGKRGDAKKPRYWKEKPGQRGFSSKSRKKVKALNLGVVHEQLNFWLEKGLATKKPAGYEIELKKLGYNKLLGTGPVKQKLIIITDFASKKAIDKVKKAGGEVKVLQVKKEKVKKAPVKKKVEQEEVEEKIEEVQQKSAKPDFAGSTDQDLLKSKISEGSYGTKAEPKEGEKKEN